MSDDTKQSKLNDHERRVYAKIVDDLSDLDVESQRHVFQRLQADLDDRSGYHAWPMFFAKDR